MHIDNLCPRPGSGLLRFTATLLFCALSGVAAADCVSPHWQPVATIPQAADYLATADFNGDGRADVVFNTATAVSTILTDSNGALGTPVTQYNGIVRGRIHTHDMDVDGHADILFVSSNSLIVRASAGNGTFDGAAVSPIDIAPSHLAIGNFNQDNAPDVIAVDAALAQLVVYANDGNGVLHEASRITVNAEASSLMAADMDADGATDAVIGYPDGDYRVHYGNGNGTLGTPVRIRGAYYRPNAMRAAHADSDGLLDIFVATDYSTSVVRNLGSRNFGDPASYSSTYQVMDIEVGDVTGDGVTDAVTMHRDCSMRTWTGNGLGSFRQGRASRSPNNCFGSVPKSDGALGDFDGDGRMDLVVLPTLQFTPGYYYPNPVDGVQLYRNRCGEGRLLVTVDTPVVNPSGTATVRAEVRAPFDESVGTVFIGIGTATLQKDGVDVSTVQFSGGYGRFPLTGLPLGTHTYTVRYNGDAQYEPIATSDPVSVRVTAATTATAITIQPNPAQWGTTPTININVTSSTGSAPTGVVEIKINGKAVGCYDCAAPSLSMTAWDWDDIGTYTVTAKYLGDADHPPSAIAETTYTITKKTPSILVYHSAVLAGTPFTMNVAIDNDYGVQGTVTVYRGETQLDAKTFASPGSSGNMYLQIPALPAGQHTLRVMYSGDTKRTAGERLHVIQVFPATGSWLDARGTATGITVSSHSQTLSSGYRRKAGEAWGPGNTYCCTNDLWYDPSAPAGFIYLYRLQNYNGTETSNVDLAQLISFTDDPLLAGTTIRTVHLQEIVSGMNALRTAAGLTPLPSSGYAAGAAITASGINVLRNAINEARSSLGASPYVFTGSIAAGDVVRAAHIQELREAIR